MRDRSLKTAALVVIMFFACFPVFSQTALNRGLLLVFDDIHEDPKQFAGSETFHTIVIHGSTKSIPEEGFAGTSVRNLTFMVPSSVSIIPNGAFSENYFLINVNLPDSLTVIGEAAFGSCVSLQRITLPQGLKEIHFAAFWNTRLTSLYIPDSVEYIGAAILYNTNTIESLRLPANANINENNDFYHAYVENDRRAGVYIRVNETWTYRRDMAESEYDSTR
jgi:hypothetical protein